MLRILVGLRRLENNEITLARFVDCLVNVFKKEGGNIRVNCKLENNQLILSNSQTSSPSNNNNSLMPLTLESNDLEDVLLYHSPICPLHMIENLSQFPSEYLLKGIEVAVCVLVESSDTKILLTQRSSKMRTFPNNWVPPGGHLELNESFLKGGLRELREETGLNLNPTNSTTTILCLWESVYPVTLGFGLPKKHHIVMYLLTKSKEKSSSLQSQIKLDTEEVQAFAWITTDVIKKLCIGEEDQVEKYSFNSMGVLEKQITKLSQMFSLEVWTSGVYFTATQAALNNWLKSKRKLQNKM